MRPRAVLRYNLILMQTIADIFGQDGPLAKALAESEQDYSPRTEQVEMAEAIAAALERGESIICEAGAGTGKTLAYLLPVLLSGRKALISTGTRHLQDQIFSKDLPLAEKALGRPVRAARLKGRANYLCLLHLKQAEAGARLVDSNSGKFLPDIRAWSQQTDTGDLAELAQVPEDAPVLSTCVSTYENCLGQGCEFYDDCFVFKARRRAAAAELAVVNHHLFMMDMRLRESADSGGFLPDDPEVVVFDEAHQLPKLAFRYFGRPLLSSKGLLTLSEDALAAHLEEAPDLRDFPALLDEYDQAVADLRLSFPRAKQEEQRRAWEDIKNSKRVILAMVNLLEQARAVQEVLSANAERGLKLKNCCSRMEQALEMIVLFNKPEEEDWVRWVEIHKKTFTLHRTPLDVSDLFRKGLDERETLSIFTSATLRAGKKFVYFQKQLGLDEDVDAQSWDSPFDFQNQSLLYLPKEMPDSYDPTYTLRLIELATPVLKLTGGRAFILFTSHRALEEAANLLSGVIDYPLLIQGDAPRHELLEEFKSLGNAVLLGAASFWEGVDVKGPALSCVIIDKLPFAAPKEPVLEARLRRMEERGENRFWEYQLPEAALTLKQGAGRLLRDRNDYGILMIGDPRLKSMKYGQVFLRSLPRIPRTTKLEEVEAFWRRHEPGAAEEEGEAGADPAP